MIIDKNNNLLLLLIIFYNFQETWNLINFDIIDLFDNRIQK